MNEQECEEVYIRLVEMLNYVQLNWVVEEVNGEIRLGKTGEKQATLTYKKSDDEMTLVDVEVEKYTEDEITKSLRYAEKQSKIGNKKSTAYFTGTLEYTPKEQLLLLIEAIERAVVQTVEIEITVTGFFYLQGEKLNIKPEIIFRSEQENEEALELTSKAISQARRQAVSELKELIRKLRVEVSNNDSQ